MKRTIFFTGEMKEKFGDKIVLDSDSLQDVVKGVEANRPGFRLYLVSLADRGLDLRAYNAGKILSKEQAPLFPLKDGDVILSVAPVGEGLGDLWKSVVGVFTTIIGVVISPFAPTVGMFLIGQGIGMVAQGIAEYLAPDPIEIEEGEESYLFSGPNNRFLSGKTLPVIYGELRVGGFPMNVQIVTQPFDAVETHMDSEGNIYAGRA